MNWLSKRPYIVFILPGFLLYTALVIYPIFSALSVSLTHWNGIGERTFVGIANYLELFREPALSSQFTNALGNNLRLFLMALLVTTPLQIYTAYLIYCRVTGSGFAQVMVFAPQFISSPIIVLMGILLLDSNVGIINRIIHVVAGPQYVQQWLGSPRYAIFAVWGLMTFAGFGIGTLFLVGAMRMIPDEMIEAGRIDGAGHWQTLFRIVLPQIKGTIFNLAILAYIVMMTVFDVNYVLGGSSGGINYSYDSMALFFYRVAFGNIGAMGGTLSANSMGMGTTIAVCMFVITFVFSIVQVVFIYGKRAEE